MDGHRSRRQLHLLALAHPLVGPSAVDLDRGDRGRHLLDVADEGRQRGPDRGLVETARWVRSRRAHPRRRRSSWPRRAGSWRRTPSRSASGARAAGWRGRRRGPARRSPSGRGCRRGRPCGCRQAPYPRHDVVGGDAGRLVDDHEAGARRSCVVGRRARPPPPRAASCTGPPRRRTSLPRAAAAASSRAPGPGEHVVEVTGVLRQRVGDERPASARAACRAAWPPPSGAGPWPTPARRRCWPGRRPRRRPCRRSTPAGCHRSPGRRSP